jgi:hypothetical protein
MAKGWRSLAWLLLLPFQWLRLRLALLFEPVAVAADVLKQTSHNPCRPANNRQDGFFQMLVEQAS